MLAEIPAIIVDCLELTAINGHRRLFKEIQLPANEKELAAHLSDGLAVVFPEFGNRFEIWAWPPQQPHQLDIALSFAFQTAAGLDPVKVTVDIELEEN